MRVKRHRKFQRYMNFFQQQFYYTSPFQILVDGTFANAVLGAKVNMREQLPKYFDGPCKLLTTPCALIETEQLGPSLYGAVQILKGLQLHKCEHGDKPVPAASCVKSIVGKHKPKKQDRDETDNHFVVATQDASLRSSLRKLIGIPLLYLHGTAPTLEKPSDSTVAWTEKRDKKKSNVTSYQKEILHQIKEDLLPEAPVPVPKGTRKRKRVGPNPLSCKKKKNNSQPNQQSNVAGASKDESSKRKRKRIKVRVPKHVRELSTSTPN